MPKITGARSFQAKLKRLSGPEKEKNITAALFSLGESIQVEAQISITNGSVSGSAHKPSRSGTPPNNDTGVLANNIETAVVVPMKVEVSSNAPYARIHEFGGVINHPGGTPYFIGKDGKAVFVSKSGYGAYHNLPVTKPHEIVMPERPYMRPAVAKVRTKAVYKKLRGLVNAIVTGKASD